MPRLASLPTLLLALLAPAAVLGSAPAAAAPQISPAIGRALRMGVASPGNTRALAPTPGQAAVMIELAENAGPADLAALTHAGASLRRLDGAALRYGRFVPARVGPAALARLALMGNVRRVSLAPARSLHPMDRSGEVIGLHSARGARPALDLLTGKGVVVADLDSNADVYHPQFFRADAGYFDWIDVNDNALFDPGTDAIDLDQDGVADADETAQPIIAETLQLFYGTPLPARELTFDPATDWLYLDQNVNAKRDYGAKDGFDDATPAFGEPLFVPDDVNLDGRLSVGERVARLGTSKFAKVFVNIEYYGDVNHVFERGKDLSSLELNYTDNAYGYSDAVHASGVLSIVAGDVPFPGRRWVGVAPDADLLLGFELAQDTSASLAWALGEAPDVMLHETAGWTGFPLDGSDVYSVMVGESMVNDDVTHTCPTGNTGGARKHVNVALQSGADGTVPLTVPDLGAGSLQYAQISLNFRGGEVGAVVLKEPGGQTHDLTSGAGEQVLSTGAALYIARETTDRDTDFMDIILYTPGAQALTKPLPVGEWELLVQGHAQNDITLDGYLADNVSGWGEGVAWSASEATDDRTIGIPAVSDHCISVGAHTGHPMTASEPWYYSPEGPGEIRAYSGRGPRIDGVQKPDVLAPDNPWSAAPFGIAYAGGEEVPHGGMWPLGGTSGATPHVTGVAALLAEASIRGNDALQAVRSGAVSDATTGAVPNMEYGYGRLSAAGALGVSNDSEPPVLTLQLSPSVMPLGSLATITPAASDPDGDEAAIELKWDDGYDGEWDGEYGKLEARTVQRDQVGRYPYKARVRDAQGRIAEAVVWIEVTAAPLQPDAGLDAEIEGGLDGGADTGAEAEASVPGPAAAVGEDDDGCGCRVAVGAGGGLGGFGWIAGLAAAAVLGSRRSRRR